MVVFCSWWWWEALADVDEERETSSEWGFPEGKLGQSRGKEGGVKEDGCMMEVVGDGNVVVFTYLIF